jgi:hypothetical protein
VGYLRSVPSFPSVWVVSAGGWGFERNHCCALGFLWEDKSVCENGSRCLAAKCIGKL